MIRHNPKARLRVTRYHQLREVETIALWRTAMHHRSARRMVQPERSTMAIINIPDKTISCKIVYYGTGLGGKTTNLKYIYSRLSPSCCGEIIILQTETERTLFFDFLSMDLGTVAGFTTRFALYTVPGQVEYNASRRLILNGADGIVFVADSDVMRSSENIESL